MSNRVTDQCPPFFLIEDSVVEDYKLTPSEGWLYCVIAKYANHRTGEAFPSVQTLADKAGMSKASVIRYTKRLEEKKLIRVTREENTPGQRRGVNHYWLLTATGSVSHSNWVGITQQRGSVSDVVQNQSVLEPESIEPKEEKENSKEKEFLFSSKESPNLSPASASIPEPEPQPPAARPPPSPESLIQAWADAYDYTQGAMKISMVTSARIKAAKAMLKLSPGFTPENIRLFIQGKQAANAKPIEFIFMTEPLSIWLATRPAPRIIPIDDGYVIPDGPLVSAETAEATRKAFEALTEKMVTEI